MESYIFITTTLLNANIAEFAALFATGLGYAVARGLSARVCCK